MGAIRFDTSEWPLVRMTVDGQQSDADVEELLKHFGELIDRGEPYYMLAEVRSYSVDFGHVKRIAQWTLEHRQRVLEGVAGAVLLIPSDTFRMMLSTFFLVTPIPVPFLVTKSLEEASDFLDELRSGRGN